MLFANIPFIFSETEQPFDPTSVTPGVIGFLATIFLIGVVVLLVRSLVRRIRRVQYRAEVNERLDAEQAQSTPPEQAPTD